MRDLVIARPFAAAAACVAGALGAGLAWWRRWARPRLAKVPAAAAAARRDQRHRLKAAKFAAKKASQKERSKERAERQFGALRLACGGSADEAATRLRDERRSRKAEEDGARARLEALAASGRPDVVDIEIDLSWYAAADDRSRKSLVRQLQNTTAFLKRARDPPRLTLSSYDAAAALDLGGASWPLRRAARSVWDLAPETVTYLSPDAPEPLQSLEAGRTYVIGGIVDRTVRKGASYEAALARGFSAARLPLAEHRAALGFDRRAVLNVDTVAKILFDLHDNEGDWLAAFQSALPDGRPTPPRAPPP
ncbi:hypothetical protein M885DRAFT_543373 [Pelagophyceae sp. CCMP2097]|nr:hypothetical protein M885DRAFT_543373 [Pelagophyceae sp. CCMP2097]